MQEMNILYPFDDNYAPYAGVSLTSLLENNRNAEEINIYILGFDLSEKSVEKFKKTAEKYGRPITFIDTGAVMALIKDLELPSYRGAAVAAARLFITRYMPEEAERVLYLDSDTTVTGDIRDLFDEDLDGFAAGMVCDSVAGDYRTYIGFGRDEDYYNAGMILYNMPQWRNHDCTGLIIEHIRNKRNNYEALDQDLINLALKDRIKRLDLRYNYQPFHLVYTPGTYLKVYGKKGYYSEEELQKAGEDVRILHAFRYLGMFPWHKDSLHPCKAEFEHYKDMSEWNDIKPARDSLDSPAIVIERILCRMLPKPLFLRLFKTIFQIQMKRIEKKLQKNKAYVNI